MRCVKLIYSIKCLIILRISQQHKLPNNNKFTFQGSAILIQPAFCHRMSENCFIAKLPRIDPSGGSNGDIIIQTTWKSNEVFITLLCVDTNAGYSGRLPHSQLSSTADRLEIPFADFLAESKSYLTQSPLGLDYPSNKFVFEIKDATFTWRKQVSDQLRIIYGSVPLAATPCVHFDLLNRLLDAQSAQRSELAQMAAESKRLLIDNVQLQEVLTKCVAEKTDLEQVLLRKFLELINGKKRRIVQLEEELRAQKENTERYKVASNCSRQQNIEPDSDGEQLENETNDSSEESDAEYCINRRSAIKSAMVKRLNSDSSQPSQESVQKVLPKRIKGLAEPSATKPVADNSCNSASSLDQQGSYILPFANKSYILCFIKQVVPILH